MAKAKKPGIKELRAARESFKARIIAELEPHGLMESDGGHYTYTLPTPVGELGISFPSASGSGYLCIHQRFNNECAGLAYLGEIFNAKWNFIYSDDVETLGGENATGNYLFYIRKLLAFKPDEHFWNRARAIQVEKAARYAALCSNSREETANV